MNQQSDSKPSLRERAEKLENLIRDIAVGRTPSGDKGDSIIAAILAFAQAVAAEAREEAVQRIAALRKPFKPSTDEGYEMHQAGYDSALDAAIKAVKE